MLSAVKLGEIVVLDRDPTPHAEPCVSPTNHVRGETETQVGCARRTPATPSRPVAAPLSYYALRSTYCTPSECFIFD